MLFVHLELSSDIWLTLQKVVERLGLSYKTANELNQIINQELPGHPPFKSQELVIRGKSI